MGGYDESRFIPNGISFGFAPDNERDIVVGIQKITSTDSSSSRVTELLPEPIYSYIDSTVPQIWLPIEACQVFEDSFGLTYDNDTELYLVNSTAHELLLSRNPNVTFTIGVGTTGGSTVDIVLPYAAFDMTARPPYQGLSEDTLYFPLRRAANATQYTLGRTFLQEAYLIVDWERQNFSVSQCDWQQNMNQHLVPITDLTDGSATATGGSSAEMASSASSSSLSTGAIAGIAVGAGILGIGLVLLAFFLVRRRRRSQSPQHKKFDSTTEITISDGKRDDERDEPETKVFPKAELDATEVRRHEMATRTSKDGADTSPNGTPLPRKEGLGFFAPTVESDSREREVYEMPGDMPIRPEADGRQLSEKEGMMFREAKYNGQDPITPISANEDGTISSLPNSDGTRRTPRTPVSPADVVALSRLGEGTIGPISPLESSSQGSQTFFGRFLSPFGRAPSERDPNRKRFSWEGEEGTGTGTFTATGSGANSGTMSSEGTQKTDASVSSKYSRLTHDAE